MIFDFTSWCSVMRELAVSDFCVFATFASFNVILLLNYIPNKTDSCVTTY